jgi:16S rRNA (cytidine1402-2'-O)-methyltransferase
MPDPSFSIDPSLIESIGLPAQDLPAAALYVDATPIGNAGDITLRALWILAQVDAIACEDTRTTRPLLERYGIRATLLPAHQHNERAAAERIAERLRRGERIALVSDAGTPAVSDPGARLVATLRAAGHRIVPVPGASSLTAAVSVAGLREGPWTFIGFPPGGAQQRARLFADLAASGWAVALLEAPHRISATAGELAQSFAADRRVVLARELTKRFETLIDGALDELGARLAADADQQRGEFVLLLAGAADDEAAAKLAEGRRVHAILRRELPPSRAARLAAEITGAPRKALYDGGEEV